MIQFFKYVRHSDVEIHERKGWAFHADLGALLMTRPTHSRRLAFRLRENCSDV